MITLSPVMGGIGSISDLEQWLLSIYPNLSAPAINFKKQGYMTLHRTLTPEQAIAYWRDENSIIATRPGAIVHDIRIDLDFGGCYWSLEIIDRLRALFESKGLPGSVLCRSSDSEGRWLVVPLPESMPSWQASLTAASIFTDAGYQIENGHLEISPNVKRWVNRGKEAPKGFKSDWIVDHNAFRMPCQKGFEILDSDGETIGLTLAEYRHHWEWAQSQQCSDEWQATVDYYSQKKNRPKSFKPRGKGTIGEIEREHLELCDLGFTDASQTNDIGLNLARRLRMLYPGDMGHQAELIKQAFISMPGYREHCHHQHEIERRSRDLARWADKNWSYYGDRLQKPTEEPKPNQNLVRHTKTVNKLTRVLMDWITNEFTFASKNQIFEALKRHCGVGKKTFYKYLKELANFAALIKKLLSPENHAQQDSKNQFTPSTTKLMNCCVFSSVASPAHQQSEEKKYLTPDVCGVSVSAQDQFSNTQTSPSDTRFQELENIREKRQLMRICKALHRSSKPELLAELDQIVARFGLSTITDWIAQMQRPIISAGFEIWQQHQQLEPTVKQFQNKLKVIAETSPESNTVRKSKTDSEKVKPQYSVGQRIWFYSQWASKWLQGTVRQVLEGKIIEYCVLSDTGTGASISNLDLLVPA